MKKSSLGLFAVAACIQGALCFADFVPTAMPQGTPPQISDQTKRLIQGQLQASPKLAPMSATAAPTAAAIPENLSALGNGQGKSGAAADNFDNQHAYHNQIKQYLKTQKR